MDETRPQLAPGEEYGSPAPKDDDSVQDACSVIIIDDNPSPSPKGEDRRLMERVALQWSLAHEKGKGNQTQEKGKQPLDLTKPGSHHLAASTQERLLGQDLWYIPPSLSVDVDDAPEDPKPSSQINENDAAEQTLSVADCRTEIEANSSKDPKPSGQTNENDAAEQTLSVADCRTDTEANSSKDPKPSSQIIVDDVAEQALSVLECHSGTEATSSKDPKPSSQIIVNDIAQQVLSALDYCTCAEADPCKSSQPAVAVDKPAGEPRQSHPAVAEYDPTAEPGQPHPAVAEYDPTASTQQDPQPAVAENDPNAVPEQGPQPDGQRNAKRRADTPVCNLETSTKRQRQASEHSVSHPTSNPRSASESTVDIRLAVGWSGPQEGAESGIKHLLARRHPGFSLGHEQPNGIIASISDDQLPWEENSIPYEHHRYPLLLVAKSSFMTDSFDGILEESREECAGFLSSRFPVPENTLFGREIFRYTCLKVENRNKARVIRDITPLMVPQAENMQYGIHGVFEGRTLIESVNEAWDNSIPLIGTRPPEPVYSVGFRREAFSKRQLIRLSPFVGDYITGDQSLFMGTYEMYFPFLTCEVQCGATSLEVADRQNAHSMTLAVRGVVELFRAVGRQSEVNRRILAFSISHSHRSVRIYGHYAVIDAEGVEYYRHPILDYSFTAHEGKEKWASYHFFSNVYETWVPDHLKRIKSAIKQLPYGGSSVPQASLGQPLESQPQPDLGAGDAVLLTSQQLGGGICTLD